MKNEEITNLIKELIEKTTIPVNDISVSEGLSSNKSNTIWLSVDVKEPQYFLSHNAEALFALNHLARKIIENKINFNIEKEILTPDSNELNKDKGLEILIDINDFQKKRIESIHAVAYMMAERARYFKSKIEIDPMPAFERRIVHEFLADASDLETVSEGVGPSRRVVIKYIGNI